MNVLPANMVIRVRVRRPIAGLILCSVLIGCGGNARDEGQNDQAEAAAPAISSAKPAPIRFGITTDAHLLGRTSPQHEAHIGRFIEAMRRWQPDFVIDLGDFACQIGQGQTTPQLHDGQLAGLRYHWAQYSNAPCPAYIAMGNHDVGWISGADERIEPQQLYGRGHGGEDITKQEFLTVTKMPHRYYSFDVKGWHFIVLDANNWRGRTAVPAGRDGVEGAYWIDDTQKAWLARDLAAAGQQMKIVLCHQELHHTPIEGSGEGGKAPFAAVGKESSYVDNGWELREMFKADGKVVACFAGHKHRNRWTVYGQTHYITLAATHWGGSYAKVTITDKLIIEGAGRQRSHTFPISTPREDR